MIIMNVNFIDRAELAVFGRVGLPSEGQNTILMKIMLIFGLCEHWCQELPLLLIEFGTVTVWPFCKCTQACTLGTTRVAQYRAAARGCFSGDWETFIREALTV
jgi:hypothetical protein